MFAVTATPALVVARGTAAPKRRASPVASVRAEADHKGTPAKSASVPSLALAAFAAATVATTGCAPVAFANDHYANDCDPICHVLDDGAAKSKKQEEDMKKSGPEMGSLMDQLIAQRKAEEAAAKAGAKK